MSCSLDRTKLDMRKKDIIDNNDILKDKSATGVNRLKKYALNLKNLAYSKFGNFGIKPFIEPFTNNVQFNISFFETVDKFNEEMEKNRIKAEKENIGTDFYMGDEALREQEEKNLEDLYKEAMDIDEETIEERIKKCN